VEQVFGQIKEARGIRSFLLRSLEIAKAAWESICLTHTVLKLRRYVQGDDWRSARAYG
jgi:hypothetical protein